MNMEKHDCVTVDASVRCKFKDKEKRRNKHLDNDD